MTNLGRFGGAKDFHPLKLSIRPLRVNAKPSAPLFYMYVFLIFKVVICISFL